MELFTEKKGLFNRVKNLTFHLKAEFHDSQLKIKDINFGIKYYEYYKKVQETK